MQRNFLPFVMDFWPFYAYEHLRLEQRRNSRGREVISPRLPPAILYCLHLITAFCFAPNNNKIKKKNEDKWERKPMM